MLIKNVTKQGLENALKDANTIFGDNLQFNNFTQLNQLGTRFRVTLRVKNSHREGARLGYTEYDQHGRYVSPLEDSTSPTHRRHLISACWHAHGCFFSCLFVLSPEAIIISRGKKITADQGNWEDFNMGSRFLPFWASRACACTRRRNQYR